MSGPAVPLLETKLHAPRRRRGVVARSRLDGRLDGGDLPAVVLVSAPAGFGKTTLLTEWLAALARRGTAIAWVSLDGRDSDPSVFWTYLVVALQRVVPGVGEDATTKLHAAPLALESVVGSLINDLAGQDDEVALVLDDYHAVESLEVQESMLFLVEHLPPQVHLVVGSRTDPPWPLGRLRGRGELREVRATDLRFDGREAAAYLNDEMGLALAEADVEALAGRTEGWIAALQLAALSLRGRADASGFVTTFAGDDRFVVDYLVDEVLDRQSDDVRSFLLATSILSRLTGPLCAAVTERDDARAVLEGLDRSNMFLVALDDRREWYRYHHLFADVLRARLAEQPDDHRSALHRRAGAWCEEHGDRPEAIRHALAAHDVERAAELIELSVQELRQTRQDGTLRAWMDSLPESAFADRPVLNLGRVGSRMVTSEVEGVDAMLDQVEAWLDPGRPTDDLVVHDHAELARLPAQAAMYRAGLALLHGDLVGTVAHGRRAAELSAPDDHLGRGAAAALIGLAQWTDGDLRSSSHQYARAIAEFTAGRQLTSVLGCSLSLADVQVALGRLGEAVQTLTGALDLTSSHDVPRGVADLHVGLAEVHLERDERAQAAARLQVSLDLGEGATLLQHPYRWRVVDARLRAIDGDLPGAVALLGEADRVYATDYSPRTRPVDATIARALLVGGDSAAARAWSAASGLDAESEPSYVREYELLTLARVLLADGRAEDAAALLQRVSQAAESGGREGSAIEAQMLLGLAWDACGDRTRALDAVADALDRAGSERYVRIFLDEGAPMAALVRAAAAEGRGGEVAATLLAVGSPPSSSAAPVASAAPQGLVDPLSRRELDVLRLLGTDLTGPEIAAEMVVSLNTVRTHTKSIYSKLGVSNRRAAVRRAAELGLASLR